MIKVIKYLLNQIQILVTLYSILGIGIVVVVGNGGSGSNGNAIDVVQDFLFYSPV